MKPDIADPPCAAVNRTSGLPALGEGPCDGMADPASGGAGSARGGRAMDAVRRARVWLSRAVEPGHGVVHGFIAEVGPVEATRRIRSGTAPPDVDRVAAARRDIDQVDADLATAAECGLRVIVPEDEEWPAYALLRMESATARGVPDLAPPLMFWAAGGGRLDEVLDRSVAVVGSRAATSYGIRVASTFSHQLASRDWTVVSGGALGIDAAAHKGALSAGGRTVAVVAGGLDRPYPEKNQGLFERIVKDDGLLLSEWPPGSPPQRHRFLVRNRVIAGLVSGTVVVEAGTRSGASQTARRSRELGVPVMAVPGPVVSALSVGCHQLVRTGCASLVTNVAEILEEVGRLGDDLADRPRAPDTVVDRLDQTTQQVLDGMPSRSTVRPEEIARSAGVDVLTVLRCLPALELLGLVRHEHGAWALSRTPPRAPRTT